MISTTVLSVFLSCGFYRRVYDVGFFLTKFHWVFFVFRNFFSFVFVVDARMNVCQRKVGRCVCVILSDVIRGEIAG